MIKRTAFFSLVITLTAICMPIRSFPQSTGGGTDMVSPNAQGPSGGAQNPDVVQGQADVPEHDVYPGVDLNPFGLSTMGGGSDVKARDSVGTLGTTTKHPSNVDVNRPKEQFPEESAEKRDEGSEESFNQADVVNQPPSSTSRKNKRESIYRWTDQDGVLHVTNDLGTVPPQYQEQALKQSSTRQDFNR